MFAENTYTNQMINRTIGEQLGVIALFANCREEPFSETGLSVYGVLGKIQFRDCGPTDHFVCSHVAEGADKFLNGLRGGGDGARHIVGGRSKVAVIVTDVIAPSSRVWA